MWTGSAAHSQYAGKRQAPRVDTVCTSRKAAFQQIIWWPDLDLSWLMPRVKLLQVLLVRDAALSPTHRVSTLHRVDVIKTLHVRGAAYLIKAVIKAAENIHPVSYCYDMAAFYCVDHTYSNITVSLLIISYFFVSFAFSEILTFLSRKN